MRPVTTCEATAGGIGLRLYPNPVRDQFTISLNNDQTGRMLVQIVDGVGSVKATYNFSKTSDPVQENISVAGLSAGVYFVRIQVGNKLEVKKIVKL